MILISQLRAELNHCVADREISIGLFFRWCLQVAVLSLCLQPLEVLSSTQKIGLCWIHMIFTVQEQVRRYFCARLIQQFYEAAHFSVLGVSSWWRLRLISLWLLQTGLFVFGIIIAAGLFGLNSTAFGLYIVCWVVLSPVYYLFWMLFY